MDLEIGSGEGEGVGGGEGGEVVGLCEGELGEVEFYVDGVEVEGDGGVGGAVDFEVGEVIDDCGGEGGVFGGFGVFCLFVGF